MALRTAGLESQAIRIAVTSPLARCRPRDSDGDNNKQQGTLLRASDPKEPQRLTHNQFLHIGSEAASSAAAQHNKTQYDEPLPGAAMATNFHMNTPTCDNTV